MITLVESLAGSFTVTEIVRDDLRSAGYLAYVEASRSWRTDGGSPRDKWLRMHIRLAMVETLRRWFCIPKRVYREMSEEERAQFFARVDSVDLPSGADGVEDLLERRDRESVVLAAIGNLPTQEAAVVLGHYYAGARFQDVARRLGKSKGWVSRLNRRALTRLRNMPAVRHAA